MLAGICKLSRLKNFFRAGINYSDYGKILQNTERKFTGNLPTDVMESIFRLHPENKKEVILGTQSVFEETASVLGNINKLEKQAINRMPSTPRAQERQVYFMIKNKLNLSWADASYKEKELETVIKAEETMLRGLKKYFPEAENVVITPLGSGAFGHGFKCEIFGKGGKKLINDKVFKVYREDNLAVLMAEKNKRWLKTVSDEDLLEHSQRAARMFNKAYPDFQIPLPTSGAEIRKTLNEQYEMVSTCLQDVQKVHGAVAEANTSEYLKFAAGHKISPEDGIAIPYMFGLGSTKFSLAEYIDKTRKATKEFEFGRLGLKHGDFKLNPGNNFNGICIDMGGVSPLSEDLMSNDMALKFLKKLFRTSSDSRKQLFEQFKTSVSPKEVSPELISEMENLLIAA